MMTTPIGIEAVQAIQALQPQGATAIAGAAQQPGAMSFTQLVDKGLNDVNQQLTASQIDLQRMAVGDVQNLHEVMIRLEEAQLSFQLFMQVRNRFLEAYQDVMKMQI
jgi:flagellar hook-basal body complex protein FliE